jgi:hypothetical protein
MTSLKMCTLSPVEDFENFQNQLAAGQQTQCTSIIKKLEVYHVVKVRIQL